MATKKVLVADDEPHVLQAMSSRLRNAGYEVLTARNGQEALETAQREHPDLVITDYCMPHLSGLELCNKLRRDPSTSSIPAIMLAAEGYRVRNQAQTGIERRLDKPIHPRHLLANVNEVLKTLPA